MTTTSPILHRIKTRVMEQLEAFHDARQLCDSWAAQSGARRFVVRNGEHYFLADLQDLRVYHRADIRHHRASVVHIGRPVVNPPVDVDFAPFGF